MEGFQVVRRRQACAKGSGSEIPWQKNEVGCRELRRSFVLWMQRVRTLTLRKIVAITHVPLDSVMQTPGAIR